MKRKYESSKPEDCQSINSDESGASTKSNTDNDQHTSDIQATKKKKNRCLVCNKKIGLTGFTCRCGGLFCGIHRYTDKHECNFDYKALGAQEIKEANPVVKADKIDKI